MPWQNEKIYNSAKEYFEDIHVAISKAKKNIDVEMYIFKLDEVGNELLNLFLAAADRAVQIRILVDGIGSPHFFGHSLMDRFPKNLQLRVFHPVPWPYSRILISEIKRPWHWLRFLKHVNSRNHKKVILVDGQTAFVGSANIMAQTLEWRELGVQVSGKEVELLNCAFENNWQRGYFKEKSWRLSFLSRTQIQQFKSPDFLLNFPLRIRFWRNRLWLKRIKDAKTRIWLTTPYFLPGVRLLGVLSQAANLGIDVRLIVPAHIDVKIVGWLMPMMLEPLLKCGVKVFAYQPKTLHAKYALIDDWTLIGTSNLNQRSIFLDMELDIILSENKSQIEIKDLFLKDQSDSVPLSLKDLSNRPIWQKLLGQLLYLVKAWL